MTAKTGPFSRSYNLFYDSRGGYGEWVYIGDGERHLQTRVDLPRHPAKPLTLERAHGGGGGYEAAAAAILFDATGDRTAAIFLCREFADEVLPRLGNHGPFNNGMWAGQKFETSAADVTKWAAGKNLGNLGQPPTWGVFIVGQSTIGDSPPRRIWDVSVEKDGYRFPLKRQGRFSSSEFYAGTYNPGARLLSESILLQVTQDPERAEVLRDGFADVIVSRIHGDAFRMSAADVSALASVNMRASLLAVEGETGMSGVAG